MDYGHAWYATLRRRDISLVEEMRAEKLLGAALHGSYELREEFQGRFTRFVAAAVEVLINRNHGTILPPGLTADLRSLAQPRTAPARYASGWEL